MTPPDPSPSTGKILPGDGGPGPLSPAQSALAWFHRLAGEELYARVMNMTAAFRVTGPVDRAALEEAAAQTVARHESLRTAIDLAATPPQQVGRDPWRPAVTEHDVPPGGDETDACRVVCEAGARPFALDEGHLVRIDVAPIGPEALVLALTVEHMVCDATSFAMFVRELLWHYASLAATGAPADLPALPIQYVDYARWQCVRSGDPARRARDLAYWDEHLSGIRPLGFPYGRRRSHVWEMKGQTQWFAVDEEQRAGLAHLAASRRATLFSVVLSAVGRALAEAADDDDASLISFVSQRARPECRDLIGLFANLSLLRLHGCRTGDWPSLVDTAKATVFGALRHGDLSFGQVVQETPAMALLDRSRGVWAALHFYNLDDYYDPRQGPAAGVIDTPGPTSGPVRLERLQDLVEATPERTILPFDLHLSVWDRGDGLLGLLRYNVTVLEETAADRLVSSIGACLADAAACGDEVRREGT